MGQVTMMMSTFKDPQEITLGSHWACPACGYDLFGIPAGAGGELRCPECGGRHAFFALYIRQAPPPVADELRYKPFDDLGPWAAPGRDVLFRLAVLLMGLVLGLGVLILWLTL